MILGYLEIMRLADTDDEMLKKVESKAKQVVDLINQFFTLAKLEAGDANITLSRINVSEICRESARLKKIYSFMPPNRGQTLDVENKDLL